MRAAIIIIKSFFFIGSAIAQKLPLPKFDKTLQEKQLKTVWPKIDKKVEQKEKNIFYEKNKNSVEDIEKVTLEKIQIEQKIEEFQEPVVSEKYLQIVQEQKKFKEIALAIIKSELEEDSKHKMLSLLPSPQEDNDFKKTSITGPSQYDSRIEPRHLDPLIDWQQQILNNAQSVGLIVKKENLYQLADTIWRLGTGLSLGEKYTLCPGQAFATQPVAGEGTAFIINENRFMTALHVLTEPINQYVVVFGFEMINKVGAYEAFIPSGDIYSVSQIVSKDDNLDIAIFETDRQINRKPLLVSTTPLDKGTEVYMVGHPSGLPKKVALNADVSDNTNTQFFYTTLDAFQGNSGSPVFDFKTHQIIGILVSGETDYTWNGNCKTVSVCRIPYCKGEKAMRVTKALVSMIE